MEKQKGSAKKTKTIGIGLYSRQQTAHCMLTRFGVVWPRSTHCGTLPKDFQDLLTSRTWKWVLDCGIITSVFHLIFQCFIQWGLKYLPSESSKKIWCIHLSLVTGYRGLPHKAKTPSLLNFGVFKWYLVYLPQFSHRLPWACLTTSCLVKPIYPNC